ncbi:MAG: rRNA adenine dimethyltransferase family protein [Nitrosopumilaceae archaeon]
MTRRQSLGQHFLISQSVARTIATAAGITKDDIVLEVGTGKGILLPFLCKDANKVISFETDKNLYTYSLTEYSNLTNLVLRYSDGFKSDDDFTVFVSNLPYSESRRAMEWLLQKKFSRAIIMVQKEFAEKITAKGKEKRAISVLVNYATNIEHIMKVNKNNFQPQPKVDSVVLKLIPKKELSKKLITLVNQLFSYKRKKIQNIYKQFGKEIKSDKRLEDLSGDEIIEIAKQIGKN